MKLLPILLLSFALLPCTAAQPAAAPARGMLQPAYSTGQALDDALDVYGKLAALAANYDELLNPAVLRDIAENIATPCQRLRQLPPEQLVQVCLLADAILWQSDWMDGMILAEYAGINVESRSTGFEELAMLSAAIQRLLGQPIPGETRAALLQLLEPLGGEKALDLPDKMYDQRMAKDFRTVLEFLQGLCAAVNAPDEATALPQLAEAREALDYLLQGGEIEKLRVAYLSRCYHASLVTNLGSHPYSIPVMPEKHRTAARMQALEPIFTPLPELRTLLLD